MRSATITGVDARMSLMVGGSSNLVAELAVSAVAKRC